MRNTETRLLVIAAAALLGIATAVNPTPADQGPRKWSPSIPRTWDDESMRSLEVPLANPQASPKHVSSDYYYRIPVRPIYKSYPVYYPSREPAGYLKWLERQGPQVVFDASKLRTSRDWIKAGEIVFDAPVEFESSGMLFDGVRDAAWYRNNRVPTTSNGILPFMRYVVREKGKVELGILACAMCHTRVLGDGSTIKGAQGNFPDDHAFAYETRMRSERATDKSEVLIDFRDFMRRSYAAPWLGDDPNARPDRMTLDQIALVLEAIPPGVCARQGTSAFYPARIPDLIGVKDRRYLDASGLVQHRAMGDLMRYAALNQGGDELSEYAGFRPAGELPDPSTLSRYSDEQLYALALFVYSLKPPPNPNRFDAAAARGKQVFLREGCAGCHTPPLYTNNKLVPVEGFEVPADHRKTYDVLAMSIGTDSRLTLKSRRGTGYYKVPSLKGVWYRGPFEHNGSVAALEDWFDSRRLKDDYVPTGFRGDGVTTRAVKGHPFGLDLQPEDRQALIAFLKSL
jgi:hypothetical protein